MNAFQVISNLTPAEIDALDLINTAMNIGISNCLSPEQRQICQPQIAYLEKHLSILVAKRRLSQWQTKMKYCRDKLIVSIEGQPSKEEQPKVPLAQKLSSFLDFCSTAFRQGKQLLMAEKAPLNGGGSSEPNQEQEQGLLAKCGKAQ